MKKGFTLIELLAVIIILGVIFTFIFPKVSGLMGIGKNRDREISESIIMDAAKEYSTNDNTLMNGLINTGDRKCITVQSLVDKGYIKTEDLDKVSINASSKVKIELNSSENLEYTIVDSCTEQTSTFNPPVLTLATELLDEKVGQGGLFRDDHGDLRYRGSNPDNYVYFNCTDITNPTSSTCELWRIIGIFDDRVKLVRKYSIGSFSWDSSDSTINGGYGINQWGVSGSYAGADLMKELNGDYLNSSLGANTNWYNGTNNAKSGTFNKSYVLNENAQKLIGDALWYTGGVPNNSTITLASVYAAERGTQGKMCSSGDYCNDEVERTYTWQGKVGLIYMSDFGYASGNASCATNISYRNSYCDTNWMARYGWTITPGPYASDAVGVWSADSAFAYINRADDPHGVRPSVYLISDIQIKGSGTTSDPYVFTK